MTPQTFVFFDIETTGLSIYSESITELCFIAVSRSSVFTNAGYPRIQQKLTLCFNPQRLVQPKAMELSGLTNDLLTEYPTFSKKAAMIVDFLQRLPQPVGLLAHNGDRFDFRLFARHLTEAGINILNLQGVVCCDTLKAFKETWKGFSSYKLSDVHETVCGQTPKDVHTAEGDCAMLREIMCGLDAELPLSWTPLSHYMSMFNEQDTF